jgi:uncharacterized protein (TIGR03067 family)
MRSSLRLSCVALLGAALIIPAALPRAVAAPRQWTDASGTFSVRAELVEFKDGQVHLKKVDDGEVIVVPVGRLSDGDRNYLANRPKTPAAPAASSDSPAANKPAPEKPAADPDSAASDADKPGLLRIADTSGDGKIIRTEWTSFVQKFRTYDADGDNAIDEKELEATGSVAELLNLADADQDKKITRTEWAALSQSFNKLDKNRDAALDAPELKNAADSSLARATGTATLPGARARQNAGPTVWRGQIEGRSQIELVVNGNVIVGREIGGGGAGNSLGTGTFTMTGDGRSGNMDATYTEGPQRGQTCMGIYMIEGDTLRWNVNNRGTRPVDFSSGGGNWPMTLQRVATPNP